MRALNLSFFLIIFFILIGVFTEFPEFSALSVDGDSITSGNISTDISDIKDDFSDDYQKTQDKLDEVSRDSGLLDTFLPYFSIMQSGLRITLRSIGYAVFCVPLMISWGVPINVSIIFQILIYLIYVISILELAGKR